MGGIRESGSVVRMVFLMRPRRLPHWSYRGCSRYSLTLCTFDRRCCFTEPGLVRDVLLQFLQCADAADFEVLAYCFMPDHLHLVAGGTTPTSDLRAFVATAKQNSAHASRRWIRGRLWQRGYYERILRDRDDVQNVIRYVLANPIRAGLVESLGDYPFAGTTDSPRS
jgi:putative transposase